jgi:hypothetical protein
MAPYLDRPGESSVRHEQPIINVKLAPVGQFIGYRGLLANFPRKLNASLKESGRF